MKNAISYIFASPYRPKKLTRTQKLVCFALSLTLALSQQPSNSTALAASASAPAEVPAFLNTNIIMVLHQMQESFSALAGCGRSLPYAILFEYEHINRQRRN
ncbi:MAG: hypothetical protein FWG42_04690 [Clostridiales bacterium]|nr:hypothetical protein [Clostridiales bacterium]